LIHADDERHFLDVVKRPVEGLVEASQFLVILDLRAVQRDLVIVIDPVGEGIAEGLGGVEV